MLRLVCACLIALSATISVARAADEGQPSAPGPSAALLIAVMAAVIAAATAIAVLLRGGS